MGKPLTAEDVAKNDPKKLEDDLVFANEKPSAAENDNAAVANGAGAASGGVPGVSLVGNVITWNNQDNKSPATKAPGVSTPNSQRPNDLRNAVYESPAMSMPGTPAVHLANFSPAPASYEGTAASILQQAATKAKASRLRDDERRQQREEGGEDAPIDLDEGDGSKSGLDKNFGFARNISTKYELESELGRGHFGHTVRAVGKKGEVKGLACAVKVIPKAGVSGNNRQCHLGFRVERMQP